MAFSVGSPVSRSKTRDFRLSGMLARSYPRPTIITSGKWGVERADWAYVSQSVQFPR